METVGSEVAIGHEHFYIISGDEDSVTMLAKYNLYVGGKYENDTWNAYGDEATGIQDETMLGYLASGQPYNGIITFSQANYWYDNGLKPVYGTEYPAYVYDENSSIYTYINNYKIYLESQGMTIDNARLIKQEELISLGCTVNGNSCTEAPEWVYGTSYWSGSAYSSIYIRGVASRGTFGNSNYNNNSHRGIRPVITISKSQF